MQYIITKIPKGSKAFVFGSVLSSEEPKDFDLLVVYDDGLCPAIHAYSYHQELVDEIEKYSKLPVHLIPLSQQEFSFSNFLTKSKAIPLHIAINKLTTRPEVDSK